MIKAILLNREAGSYPALAPVCGKSGKLYGQATYSAPHGCKVFVMDMKDYRAGIEDILKNSGVPGQLWIPDFIETHEGAPLLSPARQAALEADGLTAAHLSRDEASRRVDGLGDEVASSARYRELIVRTPKTLLGLLPPNFKAPLNGRRGVDKDKIVRTIIAQEARLTPA